MAFHLSSEQMTILFGSDGRAVEGPENSDSSRSKSGRMVRLGVALLCLTLLGVGLSKGQDQPGPNQSELDAPWERTVDGRVLIPVLGQVLAFPSDAKHLRDFNFLLSNGRYSDQFKRGPKLADILDQPRPLRRYLDGATKVVIHMTNDWDRSIQPYDFLGRFDPRSIPWTTQIYLTVGAKERSEAFGSLGSSQRSALLAAMQQRSQSDVDEFTKIIGPAMELDVSRDNFILVSQRNANIDAAGRPLYSTCRPGLGFCTVGSRGNLLGYAIRPNVQFSYDFATWHTPYSKLRGIHSALKTALESLLIIDAGSEQN